MPKVSVVIPALKEPYLQQTVDSLLAAAHGEVEIIVVLDGYWPDPIIKDDPKVSIIHNPKSKGMRASINAGARIAKGEYLMKCDAHCLFGPAWDLKLIRDCRPDRTLVPRRHGLDVEKWRRIDNKYYDFQYIEKDTLKGRNWPEHERRSPGKKIVALMTSQGSCWFMYKERFFELGGLDEVNYGGMGREAQEICLKSWLSGGEYMLSRRTWYAHWSKPQEHCLPRMNKKKSVAYATDLWINNKWPGQKHDLEWLIQRFYPVPTWHFSTNIDSCLKNGYRLDKTRLPITVKGMGRKKLYKLFSDLGYKTGCEVGVQFGANAAKMFAAIPDLKLYCVDPYRNHKFGSRKLSGSVCKAARDGAHESLKDQNVEFLENFSEDAAREIPDESLDFVYIDGDHSYEHVMLDIILWNRKVRPGGIISGHDYYYMHDRQGKLPKVTAAVNHYTKIHLITPWYITDSRATKEKGDAYPSWFWMK